MLTQTQRDNILAVISSYEARMKILRDCFERREPVPKEYEAYVAPLKDKDVVAAFESLTVLLACVQELEAQRDYLLENEIIQDNTDDLDYCPLPAGYPCSHQSASGWGCKTGSREQRKACWIKFLEKRAWV